MSKEAIINNKKMLNKKEAMTMVAARREKNTNTKKETMAMAKSVEVSVKNMMNAKEVKDMNNTNNGGRKKAVVATMAAKHKVGIPVEAICAEAAIRSQEWKNFEENYEVLLVGLDGRDEYNLWSFALRYLEEVTSMRNKDRQESALVAFLEALDWSKHYTMFEDPLIVDQICAISCELSIPYLERRVKKWTRSLYESVLWQIKDERELLCFSKKFLIAREKNTYFISLLKSGIYKGLNDYEWRDIKEWLFNPNR